MNDRKVNCNNVFIFGEKVDCFLNPDEASLYLHLTEKMKIAPSKILCKTPVFSIINPNNIKESRLRNDLHTNTAILLFVILDEPLKGKVKKVFVYDDEPDYLDGLLEDYNIPYKKVCRNEIKNDKSSILRCLEDVNEGCISEDVINVSEYSAKNIINESLEKLLGREYFGIKESSDLTCNEYVELSPLIEMYEDFCGDFHDVDKEHLKHAINKKLRELDVNLVEYNGFHIFHEVSISGLMNVIKNDHYSFSVLPYAERKKLDKCIKNDFESEGIVIDRENIFADRCYKNKIDGYLKDNPDTIKANELCINSSYDILLTNHKFEPVLLVEVDGPTHDRAEREYNDILKTCISDKLNIPLIRVKTEIFSKRQAKDDKTEVNERGNMKVIFNFVALTLFEQHVRKEIDNRIREKIQNECEIYDQESYERAIIEEESTSAIYMDKYGSGAALYDYLSNKTKCLHKQIINDVGYKFYEHSFDGKHAFNVNIKRKDGRNFVSKYIYSYAGINGTWLKYLEEPKIIELYIFHDFLELMNKHIMNYIKQGIISKA